VSVRPREFALACASLAVASVALACCAPRRFELWRQADVKQAWAPLGWDVGFDASGRITRLAQLSNGDLSGSEFEIAAFGDLESLELAHSRISDRQLAQFPIQNPGLARLKSLNLDDTPIGDAALAHLASFPGLTHLKLSRTNITDAGLSQLAALEGLTRLELAMTNVSDEAVASLSRLGQLESLDLQLTAVSEEGVKRLRAALAKATILYGASDASLKVALTNVIRQSNGYGSITIAMMPNPAKRLHARGRSSVSPVSPAVTPTTPAVGLTDSGVALLSSHTELEELDLRDSAVTDAGLTTLVKLTNLKRLDLRGAPVTEGGCQKLAKTLSNCEILR
jgi:Leucine-rich repeat (LRR) protein